MPAHLFLHLRRLTSGRVIATPIPFSELGQDGESVDEAGARAAYAAAERLAEITGPWRAVLSLEAEAELGSVRVAVGKGAGKTEVTIGLVLVSRGDDAAWSVVAYAPGIMRWAVGASSREQALAAAGPSLEELLRNWPLAQLLALDAAGEASIEPLPMPFLTDAAEIEMMGDDLTELAAAGRLGRLDRRDPLVERVLAVLSADGRASVLLVGPSDVGKSTLVHEIAARLGSGDVPPALEGRRLLRISANELIAGARFTGMWQERARELIDLARGTGAIIAMGDPSGIVDAGRWAESDNNLARILRPYVERGELRLICETNEDGVTAARKWEPSFVEAFYRVDVPEPDAEAAREILRAAARRIEANHGLPFGEDAVQAALDLTQRFEPYRALPGKAVRLLEETAQLIAVDGEDRLGREEVTAAFAQRTGMPIAMLSDQVPLRTGEVRAFFEERVLGQPEAVEEMVDLVAVIKAALNDPGKPLSTLFFVGPTGVGKTELTKALAEFLFGSRDRVLRFDMGEFSSGDAVPRLVGSAWDRRSEGELISRVRQQPFCVVLLDEIEKAHRQVYDVMLPALGEGRVTDAAGNTADLRNAIVIMTSNLGAERQGSGGLGFARAEVSDEADARRAHFVGEAERFFRPEFFNRLDRVLVFDPLDRDAIRRIARREIGRLLLREGITRRRLLVEIDDGVVERLAATGFHPRYGARPLHREIERAVIRPLARLIVEQRPTPGDLIGLEDGGEEIRLTVRRVSEPEPERARRRAPEPPTPTQATLARAADRAAELLDRVLAEQSGEHHGVVAAQLSGLLAEVNDPGFWDDPQAAKATLSRTYELQRVTDDLSRLRNRAEGLVELARQLRARRDRSRLGDLREGLADVEQRLTMVRLQCAGAAVGDDGSGAVVIVSPVGGEAAEWAQQLVAMYSAWGERTGREVAHEGNGAHRLTILGPGTEALLAGEAGLHRRELPDRRRQLARVQVASRRAAEEPPEADDRAAVVVRVYAAGRRTGVRDPRTGVTVGNLQAVLEQGQIDEFILAALRPRAPG